MSDGFDMHPDGCRCKVHADALPQHRRLVRLGDIDHRHTGRTVHVAGLTGELTGVMPLGDQIQLALIVGGARVWTDWLDADECAEVWKP